LPHSHYHLPLAAPPASSNELRNMADSCCIGFSRLPGGSSSYLNATKHAGPFGRCGTYRATALFAVAAAQTDVCHQLHYLFCRVRAVGFRAYLPKGGTGHIQQVGRHWDDQLICENGSPTTPPTYHPCARSDVRTRKKGLFINLDWTWTQYRGAACRGYQYHAFFANHLLLRRARHACRRSSPPSVHTGDTAPANLLRAGTPASYAGAAPARTLKDALL